MTSETNVTGTNATSKDEPRFIGNLMLPSAVLVISLVFYYLALGFPDQDEVGPAVVPYLWIVFTVFFSAVLIVQSLRKTITPDPKPGKIAHVWLYAGWLVVYLMAIQTMGYYSSTFIFLCTSMYMMGYRKSPVIIAIAVVWLVFAYFIFARLLFIPLPMDPMLTGILS